MTSVESPPLGSVRQFLRDQTKTVAGALAVALMGAFAFWLSPLKVVVLNKVYPERADVEVIADTTSLSPGQALQVQVKIAQRSTFPVSNGLTTLHFDSSALVLSPDTARNVNTGPVEGARILDKPFVLFPAPGKSGTTELYATLQTKFGTYTAPRVRLEVMAPREIKAPYIERHGTHALNLSGRWRIEIGGSTGFMEITQDARNDVAGTYAVDGMRDTPMRVHGYKDGTSFYVFFDRTKGGDRRWRIAANFAINKSDTRFVEMEGCAYGIQQDANILTDSPDSMCTRPRNYTGWRGIAASRFYATAQMVDRR